MTAVISSPARDTTEEVKALIEILHAAEQRLEQLTSGEVDTVADRDGQTIMLRRAQEQLRFSDAAKQAAILDALPAHIALLDTRGVIVMVNEPWRHYGIANTIQSPGYGINLNYLDICDSASGDESATARQVAAGIRSVLRGADKYFSIEYPCHSPTQQEWFLMTTSPLAGTPPTGAVIMHMNITAQKLAEESLLASESQFRDMAENISEAFSLFDVVANRFLYISPAYDGIWGQSRESLYANSAAWTETVHPDDRPSAFENYQKGVAAGKIDFEYRLIHPDGSMHWVESKSFPVCDSDGKVVRIASIAEDITVRKQAAIDLKWRTAFFESLVKTSTDGIIVVDDKNRKILQNQRVSELWKIPVEIAEDPDDSRQLQFVMNQTIDPKSFGDKVLHLYAQPNQTSEDLVALKDGTVLERYSSPVLDRDGNSFGRIWSFRDVTERMEAERTIKRSNRVYALLSNINTLIVRVRDRDELFAEACRIAVEKGGFLMAMISIVDQDTMTIVPAGSAGKNEELLTAIKGLISSPEIASSTMVARAIRGKSVVVSNDSQSDARRQIHRCGCPFNGDFALDRRQRSNRRIGPVCRRGRILP